MPADRPGLRGVVDRIVEGRAAVLVGDSEVEHHVPVDTLPAGAREGSVLVLGDTDGEIEVIGLDAGATDARRREAEERLRRLRTTRRGGRFSG